MQCRKPLVFLAAPGLCMFFIHALAAQQNSPNNTTKSTGSQAASGKSSGSSQITVRVAKPEPPKAAEASTSAKNIPDTTPRETSADKNPIRVNVNEVIVPVTVTDDKGRFVSDLDKRDFQIFEENKPQAIRFFTRERNQPVVIGFLLDLSADSRVHWQNFQNATEELIQNLLTGDQKYSGYLITYAQDAELAVDTTTAPEPLVEKVRKLKPGGGSALFDAIYLSCTSRKLIRGEPIEPRRVIVIIGDGHDNASKHSLAQVIELAQRNLVTVYCISTQAFGFTNTSDDNLVRLATETGGRVVYPLGDVYKDTDGYLSKPSDDGNYALTVGTGAYKSAVDNKMYRAVADIVGEVTTQYIIRYVPDTDSAKSYRNVKVVVDLGNVRVRARKGYYAATP
jgi:Ca-activated chloride channel family protein